MPGSRLGHCFPPGALRALYTAAYSEAYGAGEGYIYHSLTELSKENGGGGILMIRVQ
jgi:hypothetical protein